MARWEEYRLFLVDVAGTITYLANVWAIFDILGAGHIVSWYEQHYSQQYKRRGASRCVQNGTVGTEGTAVGAV